MTLNNRQIQLLRNFVKKAYDKAQKDYQEFDVDAVIDRELSYQENKRIIKEKLKELGVLEEETSYKQIKDEVEAYNRQVIEREIEQYRKEFEKKLEEIKKGNIKELNEYFKDYYSHIENWIKSDKINGFIVIGKRGFGKSYNLIYKLKSMNKDFVIQKGHITSLSFYKFLYEHKDNEIIIIDDVIKLFKEEDILSMLLGALDYENRTVSWVSSSPLTEDLPDRFQFNSKIALLLNKAPENEFIEALKDRCFYYNLDFSKEEIIQMMYIMAKARRIPLEIVDFIKEIAKDSMKNLSLRLLDKVYSYYKNLNGNWKNLAKQIIEYDEVMLFVEELISSGKSVKEQIKEFIERTGLSRRTYFRIKKKLIKKTVKVSSDI